MASDEIINEIWEVAQENSIDPIDKGEFGKDLRKAVFAELERATEGVISDINNEFARTLPIILHQAKANPEMIYENNGKGFSVASGIFTKAVLSVKYENRYIPGTAEYKKEFPKESLAEVILTGAVVDTMIENFENLSYEERITLNNNWKNLTSKQRKVVLGKTRKQIQQCKELSDEEKDTLDTAYASEEKVEDSEIAFEDLSPEEQARFAKDFLDKVGLEDPQKAEIIKNLRAMQLTDVEIRQMLMDDHRNLFQKVDALYIDVTNGNVAVKPKLFELLRDVENEAALYNATTEYVFGKMGVKRIKTTNEDVPKISQSKTDYKYTTHIMSQSYSEMKEELRENYRDEDSGLILDIPEHPESVIRSIREDVEVPEESVLPEEVLNGPTKQDTGFIKKVKELLDTLSDEDIENAFLDDELLSCLLKKTEELLWNENDKDILNKLFETRINMLINSGEMFDRDTLILEAVEYISLRAKPLNDNEYTPTYRASAEEMLFDEKGLNKAQDYLRKFNEYDGSGAGEGEGSDSSTAGTAVVQDNDTLEVDTIITHQPMPNSFINTARREDTEKDGKDLKTRKEGEGLEDLPPENDLPDNDAPNNSAKNANFLRVTRNMRTTTIDMKEIGDITMAKVKEGERQQGGAELGDESDTIQPGEIE